MRLHGGKLSLLWTPHPLPASTILLFLSSVFLATHTSAAPGDSTIGEEQNHPRLDVYGLELRHQIASYEPDFHGFDRSIIGRAGDTIQQLENNRPGASNIDPGESQFWTFPNRTLFGPKSPPGAGLPSQIEGQDVSTPPASLGRIVLYITLTTCLQPTSRNPNPNGGPDQLKLYVSTSSSNQQPDVNDNDFAVLVNGGFGSLTISVKSDVHFGVFAPRNEGFTGIYNYQLTASIDGFFASHYEDRNGYIIDSDTNSVLIYTNDTTNDSNSSTPEFQQWMNRPPVFTLYVQNQDNPSILGLHNSVCALQNLAQIRGPADIDTGMTTAGNRLPKQQFYAKNLNDSSAYYAIPAIVGNSSDSGPGVVGGGGTVWNYLNFTTKSGVCSHLGHNHGLLSNHYLPDDNCALLYNLTFCNSVAYAAPANPSAFNITALGSLYDNYASSLYQNFSYSLQQIPCNTTSSAQYSLARSCNDCDAAYRQWLCAVTIPRCEDFSNQASYLQPRALAYPFINQSYGALFEGDQAFEINKTKSYYNHSRNPMIDAVIKPGPYKEVLPCKEMCYNLTQSCPAALQFSCPLEGHGLNYTYGSLPPKGSPNGLVTCNIPLAGINESSGIRVKELLATSATLGVALVVMTI